MRGYTNPVIDSNNPDPAVLALPGGGYLAVATSNYATNSAAEDAFPIYHSANLVDWELRGHVFPAGAWPAYCDRNMWAPEIHRVNGRCGPVLAPRRPPCVCCRYLAYFSCSAPNSRHSVGVAVAGEDPFGLYVDPLGVPLIFHNEVQQPAARQQR